MKRKEKEERKKSKRSLTNPRIPEPRSPIHFLRLWLSRTTKQTLIKGDSGPMSHYQGPSPA